MRLLALVLFGVPFGYAIGGEAMAGNPVAIGMAVPILGLGAFFTATLLTSRPKSLPRKADPAKIARLERELGVGPAWEWKTMREQATTVAAPPLDAQHCPRDEACVIAHPCRACGADRGQACYDSAPICDCKGVAGDCGRCDGACAIIGGEQARPWRARYKPRASYGHKIGP